MSDLSLLRATAALSQAEISGRAYFRMHKPVAVLPAGHAGPSGDPVEQTTETKTSLSLHVAGPFEPVTMGRAGSAAGPAGP